MSNLPENRTTPTAGSTYDDTPYPSNSFPQTHPDKLCAMARLFGLAAPAPSASRVLELGCADGANLLPMAQHSPQASYLGIDASAKQVGSAQQAIAAAGLTNVEIRHQDILDFPSESGQFDYIIVHGLFSWVPENVREKILAICRDHLSENGVAIISYNALPGWGMRMALRDMMLFHTAQIPDSKTKVQQARALTALLSEAVPTEKNPFGLLLQQELEGMKKLPDNYLRHDILEEINQPFYFHEFAARATRAELQYLGEPALNQMLASSFPPKVAEVLDRVGSNIIAKEQYMDFARNRNFRQTLLCHRRAKLNRNISPVALRQFYYVSFIAGPKPEEFDLSDGAEHKFNLKTGGGIRISAKDALTKAAFAVLAEHGTRRISFDELLLAARERLDAAGISSQRSEPDDAVLLRNLLALYIRGILDIYAERPPISGKIPEKITVTPLVRYQALNSRQVTNLAHQPMRPELLHRYFLNACNGERTPEQLVGVLHEDVKAGRLTVKEGEAAVVDDDRLRAILAQHVRVLVRRTVSQGFVAG